GPGAVRRGGRPPTSPRPRTLLTPPTTPVPPGPAIRLKHGTPVLRSASRNVSVCCASAAFEEQYVPPSGIGVTAPIDATLTTAPLPRSRIAGTSAATNASADQ